MNTISSRAKILYALAGLFLVGAILVALTFVLHGDEYAMNSRNRHIYSGNVLISGGRVLDKNGKVLTEVKNGERRYNDSARIRRATLHVLGESGYIAGGVLEKYSAELVGYNLITGVFTAKEKGGNDVRLTLDAELCAEAYEAMDGRKGAVGVYNYKTGEIVCMISAPSYDVKNKPSDIDTNPAYDGAYLNKFIYGQYVPGSTFKTVTAACAAENIPDIFARKFYCSGQYDTGDGVVKCNDVHGELTFEQAYNRSCNAVFAQIANEVGAKKLENAAARMGVKSSFEISRLNTARGSVDLSKTSHTDLGWAGIGQYTDTVNPCNMMMLAGAIANGGETRIPYFVDGVYSTEGALIKDEKNTQTQTLVNTTTASVLKQLMRSTVTDYYGERYFPDMKMAAKTGTAEVGGELSPHSWMFGFSLREDFPYAFSVIIENGGSGYYGAGEVASQVMRSLFDGK
ncbi:MAG: penicillin-binding protein [Clostridia bacterium]|nr:penicillin-binding protein [Clostridia bacterium]